MLPLASAISNLMLCIKSLDSLKFESTVDPIHFLLSLLRQQMAYLGPCLAQYYCWDNNGWEYPQVLHRIQFPF